MVEERAKYETRSVERNIFLAAQQVFYERGYDGARMQEIADRAGINKAMLHYYYRSKERLFDAVFEKTLGSILPRVVEPLSSDLPLGIKIRRFVETYIDQLQQNPKIPGFLVHELNRNPERLGQVALAHVGPVLPKLRAQIEEAVVEGRIRSIRAEDLVANLVSMCVFPFLARPVMQVVMGLTEPEYDDLLNARKHSVTEFIFNALRA